MYEQHMAGCFPETPRWCLSEQVCQGSKVKGAVNGPEDWILLYIRTCLFYFSLGGTNKVVIQVGPFYGGYGWCASTQLRREQTKSFICNPALHGSKVVIMFPEPNRHLVLCEVLVFGEGTYSGIRVLMQNI